jgi:hypothetical protein
LKIWLVFNHHLKLINLYKYIFLKGLSNFLSIILSIMVSFSFMGTEAGQRILSVLRSEGPQTPAAITARLDMSPSTVLRAASTRPEEIVALGARRNRKLAALRNVRGLGRSVPIFRVSETGEVLSAGELFALFPRQFAWLPQTNPFKPQLFPGLPFFLDDIRPQGFLGRAFGLQHSDLRLPPRIQDWNNDDSLEAIARRGDDLVGNLLVGAEAFERYQAAALGQADKIDSDHPEEKYLASAQAAINGQPAGSSAGGEHPKFGATLRYQDGTIKKVLVKFSPTGDSFSALRWRDLLVCEAIALEVLREAGIPSAEARIIETPERVFLETLRFDRIGAHGRKGTLTLLALENEWGGRGEHWAKSAELLEREKRISNSTLATIRLLECFGRLIANSDRHSGNLSFYWNIGDEKVTLAPVYDMLPMLYAPSSAGEDTGKEFSLPSYDHTLLSAWKKAIPIARRYWDRVEADGRISVKFRSFAKKNLKILT